MNYKGNSRRPRVLLMLLIGAWMAPAFARAQGGDLKMTHGTLPPGWHAYDCKKEPTQCSGPGDDFQLDNFAGDNYGNAVFIMIKFNTMRFNSAAEFEAYTRKFYSENQEGGSYFKLQFSQTTYNGCSVFKCEAIWGTAEYRVYLAFAPELSGRQLWVEVAAKPVTERWKQEIAAVLGGLRFGLPCESSGSRTEEPNLPVQVVSGGLEPEPSSGGKSGATSKIRSTLPSGSGSTSPAGGGAEPTLPGALIAGLGALTAGGVLATAIATILKTNKEKQAKAGKDPQLQNPDEVVGYILQLSASSLTVDCTQSVPLSAMVWQVTAAGATTPAADATITMTIAGPAAGFLQLAPPFGCVRVDAMLSLAQQPTTFQAIINIAASGSKGGTSVPVTVTILPEYQVEFL